MEVGSVLSDLLERPARLGRGGGGNSPSQIESRQNGDLRGKLRRYRQLSPELQTKWRGRGGSTGQGLERCEGRRGLEEEEKGSRAKGKREPKEGV